MDINYAANSHKAREQKQSEQTKKKNVQKVVKGKVKTKSKSGLHQIANEFISEDAGNVKQYIILDVLLPAAKKAISEVVTNGIDMLLYGETGVSKKKNGPTVSYHTPYSSYKKDRDQPRYRSRYDFKDIILDTRREADEVLVAMEEILENYDVVTVNDYYDLCGVTGKFTDDRYGWTNLDTARVVRSYDGYTIKFPRVIPVD